MMCLQDCSVQTSCVKLENFVWIIMTIDELKVLREAEDHVEFKEAKRNFPYNGGNRIDQAERRKCFLGYVVALSNEHGGRLVFGMADHYPHDVVGTDFAQGEVGQLEDGVYESLKIRVHCEELYDELGRRVLVTTIPGRPIGRRMKFEGIALMRTEESLRNMSDEEEYAILSEQEPDFSATICPGLGLSDLDDEAIAEMKNAYANRQENSSLIHLSIDRILSDLNLLKDGQLTYAALLLLAKSEAIKAYLPQAQIVWEYRNEESQIYHDSRQVIVAPLFLAIKRLWGVINQPALNKKHPFLQTGGYIRDVFDFNEEVVREAILNAIAHRDYKISSEIVIKQYPTKIVISNSGGFPKGVTLENLITVNSTPRSRLMTEILEKTGLVERSGQGIDKIYAYTLAEGKRIPDYAGSDYFQVVLCLSAVIEDPAFLMLLSPFYKDGRLALGVDEVLTLYDVKNKNSRSYNPDTIESLKSKGLLNLDRQGSFVLPQYYYDYEYKRADDQKIGPYFVSDLRRFVLALGNHEAKSIGVILDQYKDAPNRSQLKYLISKLLKDDIVVSTGQRKGTKYLFHVKFKDVQDAYKLSDEVISSLKNKYQ